ncbi:tyrosine-type recombinase/integrase [Puniceicoccus vermicola]|uniref:Tyrosine-type recombinase/integrase n=1 Tax=Puniceicoccus vermicola TaxID=388746 RepID=A0A7X1AXZ6_9BACT|nr:tyrosine-type recombinase/integrase [Puniceicoccus vermicola]MBC2602063.1 tyrosine-type recombinase/integrase [Puniceicoccus vermicola]
MKATIPKIQKKKYPSGKPYWLVSFSADGKQVRKKFTDQNSADEFKRNQVRRYHGGLSLGAQDEAREGYEIFRAKWGVHPSLENLGFADFVRQALETYQPPKGDLEEIVREFLRIKKTQGLRTITLEQIERYMFCFLDAFRGVDLARISKADLEDYLFQPNAAGKKKPNQNEIDTIRSFFNWATGESPKTPIEKPILTNNPFRGWVSRRKDKEALIAVHDYEECQLLLEEATNCGGQKMVAWMLHTGMRPTESVKFWKVYSWANIDRKNGLIHVPGAVSKTRRPREIVISPALAAWLDFYDGEKFFTFKNEKTWAWHYVQIRKVIPEKKRAKDTLRHTKISVMIREGVPIDVVAAQMGNSREIIQNHYLRLMSEEEAEKIANLTPEQVPAHDPRKRK